MPPAMNAQTAIEQAVVVAVVEQVRGRRRREHGRDAGEQDDREHRLGAVAERFGVVVAQRDEHRPRPLEHEQRRAATSPASRPTWCRDTLTATVSAPCER